MTTRSERIMKKKQQQLQKIIAYAYRVGMADAKKEPHERFLNIDTLDGWEEDLTIAIQNALA